MQENVPTRVCTVRLEPTKMILVITLTTYDLRATSDACYWEHMPDGRSSIVNLPTVVSQYLLFVCI